MSVVVHTIHGTQLPFAREPEWVREGSDFSRAMTEQIQADVRVVPFYWSGRNSVEARRQAAEDLQRRLEESIRQNPTEEQFIVAHSHGGNVALMAIQAPKVADAIDGVVAMGTPFLDAQVRPAEELPDPETAIFAGLAAAAGVLGFGFLSSGDAGYLPLAAATFLATLALVLTGIVAAKGMARHARRIHSKIPRSHVHGSRVAIVRVQGDEATALLAGSRLAGRTTSWFWKVITSPAHRAIQKGLRSANYREWVHADSNTRVAGALVLLPTLAVVVVRLGWRFDFSLSLWIAGGLMALFATPALLLVLLAVVGMPFRLLASATLLPCGWSVPLAGPYLDVSAESSPPGTWEVTHFLRGDLQEGLAHAAHRHPEVAAFVGNWIRRRRRP